MVRTRGQKARSTRSERARARNLSAEEDGEQLVIQDEKEDKNDNAKALNRRKSPAKSSIKEPEYDGIKKDETGGNNNEDSNHEENLTETSSGRREARGDNDDDKSEHDGVEQEQEQESNKDSNDEESIVEKPSVESSEEEEEESNDDELEHDGGEKDRKEENNKLFSTLSKSRRKSLFLNSKNKKRNEKNSLTHLIPGYTAPMRLDSSSLDKYRCGTRELGMRAGRKDASTKDFVLEATTQKINNNMKKTKEGFLPKSYTAAYSHFKRGAKQTPDDTAGKGWFGMKPSVMTDDLKTDLAIIRNRTYLDPKRFYKSSDKHGKVVQVGTVIEGASEFYSSRLTNKERRANLTEELMADTATLNYAKNKFKKMAREKSYQAELRKNRPKKRARKFY